MSSKIPTRDKLIYGTGEFFNGTSTVIILMLYLKFLTDIAGLTPVTAGICVISGKLWDAISDPLIGTISDRSQSRLGRRRIFFLVFCLPASLSFVSMWFVFSGTNPLFSAVYYATSYITFKTLSTLLNVPYQALGPELTEDYNERTSLISYRMAFSIGGAILAGVIPGAIVTHFEAQGKPEIGHLVVSTAFGAVYLFIWLLIFARIKERPRPAKVHGVPFWRAFLLTLKNRSFRVLIGIYLCAFLAVDILTASAKFYVDEFLLRPGLMPAIMGTMLGLALVSIPLYSWLTKKLDRKRTFVLGATVWTAACAALAFVPAQASSVLVITVVAVIGLGLGTAFVVPWSALPEVIDLDRAVNQRSNEGIFSGVMTFLRKAATTIAIFSLSLVLEMTGYTADQVGEQPGDTRLAIRLMISIFPALFIIVGAVIASKYPITKKAYALLRKKLNGGSQTLSKKEQLELDTLLKNAY